MMVMHAPLLARLRGGARPGLAENLWPRAFEGCQGITNGLQEVDPQSLASKKGTVSLLS
jgi:hypothetical protein